MSFYKAIKFFNYSVTSFLIVLIGLIGFAGAGAANNNARILDGRLGILEFPVKLGFGVADNLQVVNNSVDVSAQIDINQGIQNALLQISRAALRAFLKALLGFFTQAFLKLLDQMEAAASKIFGLRLDLSAVKKVIVAKANKLEKSIDSFVDGLLGSASSSTAVATALKKATDPAVVAEANSKAEQDHVGSGAEKDTSKTSGTTTTTPSTTSTSSNQAEQAAQNRDTFAQTVAITKCLKQIQTREPLKNVKVGGVQVGTAARVLSFSCEGYLDFYNTALYEYDNRVNNVAKNAASSMTTLLKQAPAECNFAYIDWTAGIDKTSVDLKKSLEEAPPVSTTTDPTKLSGTLSFSSSASSFLKDIADPAKAQDAVSKLSLKPVSSSICEAGKYIPAVLLTAQTPTQSTAGNETDIAGEFLNALAQTLIDFVNQILNKILDIIVNVINNVLNQITQVSSQLGGNPLSSAIGAGINAGVSQAQVEVQKAVVEIQKQIQALVNPPKTSSFLENKLKPKDQGEVEIALNSEVNLNLS